MMDHLVKLLKYINKEIVQSSSLSIFWAYIGLITSSFVVLVTLYNLYRCFKLYFCKQFCCRTNLKDHYGEWAVISGSTDGIGLQFAKELAKRGFSIVLLGRNKEKLARTKATLEDEQNVGQVQTIEIDLAVAKAKDFERVKREINPDSKDIGILINNAGVCVSKFKRFSSYSIDSVKSMVHVNVLSAVHLTHMILPGMVQRQKGMIINVASVAAVVPSPYMSVYSATKSFLTTFTRLLQMEYSAHPIDIVSLTPGFVYTNMVTGAFTFSIRFPFVVGVEGYTRSALNAIESAPNSLTGCFTHEIMLMGMRIGDFLGLVNLGSKLGLLKQAHDSELSPVPKRRNKQPQGGELLKVETKA